MTSTSSQLLSFEEFITQYGDNGRYELIDGELRERSPTGPHEAVAGSIAGRIYVEIFRNNLNWLVPKTCLIKPSQKFSDELTSPTDSESPLNPPTLGDFEPFSPQIWGARGAKLSTFAEATALRPDVIVLDQAKLNQEPLWQEEPVICNGNTIKLVAEVVSTNWQDDYARKVEEYALLGIPEYWIVDFRGLGGLQFIGNPKRPTFIICQLVNGVYQQQQYRLEDPIYSYLFPELKLQLNDIMPS